MVAHFEVYTDNSGERRWRFRAANGQTLAVSSEGYSSKQALDRSIEICQQDEGNTETYLDNSGAFRWRWQAVNGLVICTGGESYVKRRDCESDLESFSRHAPGADVQTLVDA